MNRQIASLFLIAIFTLTFSSNICAQNRPFKAGEKLTYEAKVNKIIRGVSIANLSFMLGDAPNKKDLLIKSEAASKGSLSKLFFNFTQQIESTVDGGSEFRILESDKHDVQKQRVRDSTAAFNYQDKTVTYIENDPKNPSRPPRKIASEIPNQTHDLVSAIYSMRLLPLAVNQTFELSISDSGLVYKIPVRVTAREQQKTALGKFWCFRLEPEVFGANRFIEKDGSFIIWMTDDDRRLPVRAQINTEVSNINLKVEVRIKTANF